MSLSLDPRTPSAPAGASAPTSAVPNPRSSTEHVTAPPTHDEPESAVRAGAAGAALVVALAVVCVLLGAVLGYVGFTLWEISQGLPLTGWFQP